MPPISVMLKPASSLCNLRCDYCFYHTLAHQRESFSHGKMSAALAEEVISKALEYARGADVHFAFQGGEPLLCGLEFFQAFTAAVRNRNHCRSKIYYSIQTNGTLIDHAWCGFFKEHNFLVGLSLDGYEELHNRFRKCSRGEGTFKEVMGAAGLMNRRGVDYNILTVVTPAAAEEIESIYRFFKQSGFKYLQFIPCLAPLESGAEEGHDLTAELYGEFLLKLFKLYYRDYMSGRYISIRQFDNYVQLANGRPAEQCGMNGHCAIQFIIEGDGTVYPCDFYCLDSYRLGNISTTSFKELGARGVAAFVRDSLTVDSGCKTCPHFALCRGGCKRYRTHHSYCRAYQKFFAYAGPLMAEMR